MSHSVLFVCLGNICRSPMAAAVAERTFTELGLDWRVASAGTGDWHVGQRADPRAVNVATAAGYGLDRHRGRQVCASDFDRHEWVLAMDRTNLQTLRSMAPPDARAHVDLLLHFAGVTPPDEVPDPYFGNDDGFIEVLTLLQRAIKRLPERLEST